MAVTLGNISSSSGNTTTLSWNHTTAAGADKEIRVVVSLAAGESVASVTWDAATENISGVLIRAEQNAGGPRAEIWEINDPSGGVTRQIDVTGATKARMIAGAVDFSGADADSGVDDVGSSADGATSVSNSPTNVVADDFVVDALAIDGNEGATTGANQTDIYNTGLHATIGGSAGHQDGSNGAVMSHTNISSNDIAHAAARVPAVAGGDVSILPPAANLQLSTAAPDLRIAYAVQPPAADLQLTTAAPSLNFGFSIEVPAADLQLTTAAPNLVATDNVAIEVPAAQLILGSVADSYSEANVNIFRSLDSVDFQKVAQSFTGTGQRLRGASFWLRRSGSPTGNVTAVLYAHSGSYGVDGVPSGGALATATVDAASIATTAALVDFVFDGSYTPANGTNYFISCEYSGGDADNRIDIGMDSTTPSHAGNSASDSGGGFSADAGRDVAFYVKTAAPPSVSLPVGVTVPAADLQITTAAPAVLFGFSIEVPAAQLTLSTAAPGLVATDNVAIEVPAADLALTTATPAADLGLAPPAADLQLTTAAPSLTVGFSIEIPAAQLSLSTAAPDIATPIGIEVPAANLQITTTPPLLQAGGNVSIEIPPADLALTTAAPTVQAGANVAIEIPAAQLSLSTAAPDLALPLGIEVPAAQLALSTTAPSVQAGGDVAIEVPAAQLSLSTAAPDIALPLGIEVPAADLQITTSAAELVLGLVRQPPAGQIQISTAAPLLDVTADVALEVPAAQLALSTAIPDLFVSGQLLPGEAAIGTLGGPGAAIGTLGGPGAEVDI